RLVRLVVSGDLLAQRGALGAKVRQKTRRFWIVRMLGPDPKAEGTTADQVFCCGAALAARKLGAHGHDHGFGVVEERDLPTYRRAERNHAGVALVALRIGAATADATVRE